MLMLEVTYECFWCCKEEAEAETDLDNWFEVMFTPVGDPDSHTHLSLCRHCNDKLKIFCKEQGSDGC